MSDSIVRDEVLTVGADRRLVGIVSHPSGPRSIVRGTTISQGTRPGFIMLNAGVLHRVGPHRLHVTLARRIAAAGIAGLRLDLGGIGDSVAAPGAGSFRDSAVADTRAAMTALAEMLGIPRFVLFGICAGADNAIATALADERVTGVVLVDPPTYSTPRGQLRDLAWRVAKHGRQGDLARWGLATAARGLRRVISRHGRGGNAPPSGKRELPSLPIYRAQLTRLVDRGVRILAIFSGIHGPRYNHPDQLFEWFPELRGRIERVHFQDANHTFTELSAQAELVGTVAHWMAKHYG
jgi:hypothetical protein